MPTLLSWLEQSWGVRAEWPVTLAIRGPGFGAETEPTPAADAAAWILVALLVFCVVWIGATALFMRLRNRKRDSNEDVGLNMKARRQSSKGDSAWQRPDDWWRQ